MPAKHCHGPEWLRRRTIGSRQLKSANKQASIDTVRRLNLESSLEGHQGCVNCLEWNRSGNLLASGSDDRNVIIWDPFAATQKSLIETGHEGNIFSVKFIPNSSDTLVATCASQSEVKVTNIIKNELLMDCKSCHLDRVKRLAIHPNEPHLIWSAGEEGYIMQYDVREQHSCRPSKPQNLLIDLSAAGLNLSAKCLAINPIRDEMLAVGSNDVFIRLFDRRFINYGMAWDACTAYFTPGHLLKKDSAQKSFGATYLAFSPDGSELLANLHAEQVYLFSTYEPCQAHKSFDRTVKPLILDCANGATSQIAAAIRTATTTTTGTTTDDDNTTTNRTTTEKQCAKLPKAPKLKAYLPWQELRKFSKPIEFPARHHEFCSEMRKKLREKTTIKKDELDKINELLAETKNCLALYHLRAGALIQRGWRGDNYQAIRDCCCALALEPLDTSTLIYLAFAYYHSGDKSSVAGLLDVISTMEAAHQDLGFGDNGELQRISQTVSNLLRDTDSPNSWIFNEPDTAALDEIDQMPAYYMLTRPYYSNEGAQGQPTSNQHLRRGHGSGQWQDHRTVAPHLFYGTRPPNDDNIPNLKYMNQMFTEQIRKERQRILNSFDYTERFCGHCNMNTDIKEVNFFGQNGEFIVGGSDDGAFYIWDKETTNIVKAVHGDMQILNCLQPHPSICMLATSGIEPLVKLWSPSGKTNQDVRSLEMRCHQNQDFIFSDPLEAMIMMLYPSRDI